MANIEGERKQFPGSRADVDSTKSNLEFEIMHELGKLGDGYKDKIKNLTKERETIEALMQELSGDK